MNKRERLGGLDLPYIPVPAGSPARVEKPRFALFGVACLLLILLLSACLQPTGGGGDDDDDDDPTPTDLTCAETTRSTHGPTHEPTVQCRSDDAGVTLVIPWQGAPVEVEMLPVDELGDTPGDDEFQPLSARPLAHFRILDEESGTPLQSFEPQLELSVEYGSSEFDEAQPTMDEGEMGLGFWDASQERWLIAGHGVFESGFWVADPRLGQEGLELEADPAERTPRFAITGSEKDGRARALVAEAPESIVLAWGAVPFDMDRMMVGFEPCETIIDEREVYAVECTSTDGMVTVRVPYQDHGETVPRVIALPWNLDQTLATPSDGAEAETVHDDSLMNFLVVDEASPTTVLTEFDPPIEYEVRYTSEEIFDTAPGEEFRDLTVSYWDEGTEQLVVLGGGNTTECFDMELAQMKVGCPWGYPEAAIPTDDPAFVRGTESEPRFFRMEDEEGNGRAKFYFGLWGDRIVAFGR